MVKALACGEDRLFVFVYQYGDDDFVAYLGGAADNIKMSVCYGIESSGVYGNIFHKTPL